MSLAAETSSIYTFIPPVDEDYDYVDEDSIYFTPPRGAYLAFSIDVEKTFASYRCPIDDATATALGSFPRRTFVGYVSHFYDIPMRERTCHRIGIQLLQEGMPADQPEANVTPEMSVPAFPESYHPLGRPPIQANKPLPWSGCYHPTRLETMVRIPQGVVDYEDAWIARYETFADMAGYQDEDRRKQLQLEARKFSNRLASAPGFACTSTAEDGTEFPIDELFAQHPEAEDAIRNVLRTLADVDPLNDEEFIPVINFTPDISSMERPLSAEQWRADVESLEGILTQILERSYEEDTTRTSERKAGPIPLELLLSLPKTVVKKAASGGFKAFELLRDYSQVGTSYLIPKVRK